MNYFSQSYFNIVKLTVISSFVFGISNAQTGSGTIRLDTGDQQGTELNIEANSLFNNGGTTYQYFLTGNTDQDINFVDYVLPETLGVEQVLLTETKVLAQNPAEEFNGYVTSKFGNITKTATFNISGQQVSSPRIIPHGSVIEIYDSLSQFSDGIYFVNIETESGAKETFKFIKKDDDGIVDGPNGLSKMIESKIEEKQNQAMNRMMMENYEFTFTGELLNNQTEIEELTEGNTNTLLYNGTTKTGDTAVLPQLNGSPINNTTITLTNQNDPTKTYTYNTEGTGNQLGIFENIFVNSPDFSDTYTIEVTSNEGIFLPTTVSEDIFQDVNGEVNGLKTVEVDQIPNEQTINGTIRNYQTLSTLSGITVNLYEDDGDNDLSNDILLDSQVSGANGEYSFADVPGETSVYIVNTADGYYTKTNGTYTTPLVDTLDEMVTTKNVTAVPKFTYEDATQVEADMITMYKPLADHTEFALGHWRVYFPESPNRQLYIDEFNNVANLLGNSGAIIDSDTPFDLPTENGTYDSYQPYPQDREVHTGLIGTNITNYNGTGTGRGEKVSILGENTTFYTTAFNLGGLDWSDTDHEIGNALGFPLLTATESFQTSRDSSSGDNVAIIDSQWDKAIMPLWIDMAKLHYDTTDSQGRLVEYSMPTVFEE